jgi:hypothetical protein
MPGCPGDPMDPFSPADPSIKINNNNKYINNNFKS